MVFGRRDWPPCLLDQLHRLLSPGEISDRPDGLAAAFSLDAAFELTEAGVAFQARRDVSAVTAGNPFA